MLTINVGLVDTTNTVGADTLAEVAAALNIQVTRDLPQYWPIQATVSVLKSAHSIPQGVWPVKLVKELPPGEGGFHLTAHNQPYSKVIVTPNSLEWAIDASHETIEMLVDPSGNRFQTSTAIQISGNGVADASGQFEYLVEACDPCEANDFSYQINGVPVSDFITPHYYDTAASSGAQYSFTGAIKRPRDLLAGGYISFINPDTNEIQQILWVDTSQPPQLNTLGPATGGGNSLRAWVNSHSHPLVYKARKADPQRVKARVAHRAHIAKAAVSRAKLYP